MMPRVVVNRVFLLGLDALYREAMKRHERTELLACAKATAAALRIGPADVPVEGYYAEEAPLTEYFRLMRALQATDRGRVPEVVNLPSFLRLKEVTESSIFGVPEVEGGLLRQSRDSLSQALLDTRPQWTIPVLTAAAAVAARSSGDCSLVGLAARAQDSVALCALRESIVVHVLRIPLGIGPTSPPKFVWAVDPDLIEPAERLIQTFNTLFEERLPAAIPDNAELYCNAYERTDVEGRCVCLGFDEPQNPAGRYHWAICYDSAGQLTVQDFWHPDLWTTASYQAVLALTGRCPELPLRAGPNDPGTYGDIRL